MTYRFVAAPDNWPRNGVSVKAIAIHHAEGGGTVSWLTHPDGNSSHYVVEYDGEVVQMVREDRAAGSINPTLVRTDDDPPFTFEGETVTYGVTANRAALGGDWRNPNAAVIAIEIEGFAKDGPNDKQRAALQSLVADIRSRHPAIPALGHRDFQDYKACPGKRIPWLDYGGHGSIAKPAGDDVKFIQASDLGEAKLLRLPLATQLYYLDGTEAFKTSTAHDWDFVGLGDAKGAEKVVSVNTGRVYPDAIPRPTLLISRTGTLIDAPAPPATAAAPQTYSVKVTDPPPTIEIGGKPVINGSVTLP